MTDKQKTLAKEWARTYRGLKAFTAYVNLADSVKAAENVVILRKAEAIIVERLYQLDPDAKWWSD